MATAGDVDMAPSTAVQLQPQGTEPSFDMLVLGAGGGPMEDNLSAYWVKPARKAWQDGCISVDGGSCLGALTRLIEKHPEAFLDFDFPAKNRGSVNANAGYIYTLLTSFLVTHAHWDHISGLVLSSGSGNGRQKSVYGSKQTLSNLSSAMNGGLWPILGSYKEDNGCPFVWRAIEQNVSFQPSSGLKADIYPVSHGRHHSSTSYESSAFFLTNEQTGKSFLIFGDVDADSVSGKDFNRIIWQETAKRIQRRELSTIFIECSYSSSRPKDQLYGHMSPPYILEELMVLAQYVKVAGGGSGEGLRDSLSGINICIIHVKDPTSIEDVSPSPSPQHECVTASNEQQSSALIGSVQDLTGQINGGSAAPLKLPLQTKKRKTGPTSIQASPAPMRKSGHSSTTRTTRSSIRVPAVDAEHSLASSLLEERQQQEAKATPALSLPAAFRAKVLAELEAAERLAGLGVRFLMVEQGMRIEI